VQADLGWTATLEILTRGEGAEVRLQFLDVEQRPIRGLSVEGKLRRPATTRDDRIATFRAADGGVYVADLGDIPAGGWVFEGVATRGTQRFEFERRLIWTPPQQG
jgi:nitrogen fixation protein FixH